MASTSLFNIDFFNTEGYWIMPNFFGLEDCEIMIETLKEFRITHPTSKSLIPNNYFSKLICDRRILDIAQSILGEHFVFHHANGRELFPTDTHKVWHHDFDGDDILENNKPNMVHFMIYPNGLKLGTGALTILPKSHLLKVSRSHPNQFGIDDLSGQLVIEGEKGLLIVLNSAIWHNRTKNLSQSNRYYFNLSYCQIGTGRPEREKYREILFNTSQEVHNNHKHLFQYETI